MLLIVSGEGPTDLGHTPQREDAQGDNICPGPFLLMLLRMVGDHIGYDLSLYAVRMVSKQVLAAQLKNPAPQTPRPVRLPGYKTRKETKYFFNNAFALGLLAIAWEQNENAPLLSVLFRDSDGTASALTSRWADQWQSMMDGFDQAGCKSGVPMLPKPKSEAWLLCALKTNPYQGCADLEDKSGNDASPHSLKRQLAEALQAEPNREMLCDLIDRIDPNRIDMPSFLAFKKRLNEALQAL